MIKFEQEQNVPEEEKVIIIKAYGLEDALGVLDYYRKDYTVALTVMTEDQKERTRILDMVSGAAYFHGGRVRRVAETTFMLTPPGVDLIGEEKAEDEIFI